MTTVTIDFTDDKAAKLKAKAEACGLSLEDWFRAMADRETSLQRGRYNLADLLKQCDQDAPLSAEDQEWMEAPAVGREAL